MSRKFIDLNSRPKLYELGQNPRTISFCYVLMVHSNVGSSFIRRKRRIYYSKKEDATVKLENLKLKIFFLIGKNRAKLESLGAVEMLWLEL